MDSGLKKQECSVPDAENWVDEHAEVLFRYTYFRVGDRTVSEDLVQETFLAALQSYANFKGQSSVQTWLISILRHKIAEHFRNRQQHASANSKNILSEDDFFEKGKWKIMPSRWLAKPEEEASKKEFWDRFINCVKRLSPTLADAFICREINMMDSGEICRQLNISDTGLWSRLHRARLSLRRCLEKNWFSKL